MSWQFNLNYKNILHLETEVVYTRSKLHLILLLVRDTRFSLINFFSPIHFENNNLITIASQVKEYTPCRQILGKYVPSVLVVIWVVVVWLILGCVISLFLLWFCLPHLYSWVIWIYAFPYSGATSNILTDNNNVLSRMHLLVQCLYVVWAVEFW